MCAKTPRGRATPNNSPKCKSKTKVETPDTVSAVSACLYFNNHKTKDDQMKNHVSARYPTSAGTLAIAIAKSIDAIYTDSHKLEALNKLRDTLTDLQFEAAMSGEVAENLTDVIEEFCDKLDRQGEIRFKSNPRPLSDQERSFKG